MYKEQTHYVATISGGIYLYGINGDLVIMPSIANGQVCKLYNGSIKTS